MIKEDLKPTIEELLSFAHKRLGEEKSREIDMVRVKIEEALFWLTYHEQLALREKIDSFGEGKTQCKVVKLPKNPSKMQF